MIISINILHVNRNKVCFLTFIRSVQYRRNSSWVKENRKDIMSNLDTATTFFNACEKGDGWEGCKGFCVPNATFRSQGGVFHPPLASEANLGGLVENYTDWMTLITKEVMPGCYLTDVVAAYDANSRTALFSATFHGKHTKTPEGANLPPPTNKSAESDYVYKIHFNQEGKIDSLIKIWNSEWAAKELGWMD